MSNAPSAPLQASSRNAAGAQWDAVGRNGRKWEKKKIDKSFINDPFKTVKNILRPNPVEVLKCTKEELDSHLERTYGDPNHNVPLDELKAHSDKVMIQKSLST